MNLQKLKQRTKLGNSGFSLVELIIVIAIMAILIAVLAPMFIRYVERSRISRDVQAAGQIANAMKTTTSDPSFTLTNPFQVTWAASGGVVVDSGEAGTEATDSLAATLGTLANIAGVSTTFDTDIVFVLNPATGDLTVTGGNAGGDGGNGDFLVNALADIGT